MNKRMHVKFWGVRGSIPCPGPDTVKYGGNTPCIELRFSDLNRVFILDAGTGIRELGNHLLRPKNGCLPVNAEIFLTHTHWDHIQGFPFFAPIYVPDTTLKIYGPKIFDGITLESTLAGQLVYRYFPVCLSALPAVIKYTELREGCYDLGDGITLTTKYLNHPLLCLGYRFEYGDKVLCTAYDTEPYHNIICVAQGAPPCERAVPEEGDLTVKEGSRKLLDFYHGADFLIHDAHYTQAEYEPSKIGWGHSSIEHAISQGRTAGVKRLALFHHEPVRTDNQINELNRKYCIPADNGNMDIFFAREGMRVVI